MAKSSFNLNIGTFAKKFGFMFAEDVDAYLLLKRLDALVNEVPFNMNLHPNVISDYILPLLIEDMEFGKPTVTTHEKITVYTFVSGAPIDSALSFKTVDDIRQNFGAAVDHLKDVMSKGALAVMADSVEQQMLAQNNPDLLHKFMEMNGALTKETKVEYPTFYLTTNGVYWRIRIKARYDETPESVAKGYAAFLIGKRDE